MPGIQYVLSNQKLFQSFCPIVPHEMAISDSGKNKSKLPTLSVYPDQNGPDASAQGKGLRGLLIELETNKKYLTEICGILFTWKES